MHRIHGHRAWVWLAIVASLTLGACSQASSSSDTTASAAKSSTQAAGGQKRAASIDACHLLTGQEIQQQLGVAVDAGKLQTTPSQASCDWTGTGSNDDKAVGLIVEDLDQDVFNTFASSGRAKAVSGLGDAAFAHVPTSPTIMIRQGKYEIDIGVVDAGMSDDRWLSATKALAALVLQRVR